MGDPETVVGAGAAMEDVGTAVAEKSGMDDRRDPAGILEKPWVSVLAAGHIRVSVGI